MHLLHRLWLVFALPALLAPAGMSWTWCVCAPSRAPVAVHSCCEIARAAPVVSCCDEAPNASVGGARLRAPCRHCRDLTTPTQRLARTERVEQPLANFSLFAFEPRFNAVRREASALGVAFARAPHAPPRATLDSPLRI